jgi:uncharacterized protein YecT (DUF1311 family)
VEPADQPDVQRPMRRLNPLVIALVGGLLLLVFLVWLFAGNRNPDQDKLQGNSMNSAAAADPEKRCALQATYDLIKRDLFRRAAQVRGSDQAAYDRLSGYAVLRVENPVMESQDKDTGAINCSGSVSLDLPPGVGVVGGRRTLASDVDYTIQKAADGSGDVILLRNADAIITPLATLSRTAQAAPAETQTPVDQAAEGQQAAEPGQPAPSPIAPAQQPVATRPINARPSFDCARARTSSENAICSDAELATLDRSMAAQYGRVAAQADPSQRRLLEQTRTRFLGYRDRCPTKACIGDAYEGRMREIRDIMQGRWQPPR